MAEFVCAKCFFRIFAHDNQNNGCAMLKIYLDWNIISNLKTEKYQDLNNYLTQVKDYFIFPFSRAHIQDLFQSMSPENKVKYEKDLDTLSVLCQTHLLNFDDSIDAPYPYECTPRQFIETEDASLRLYKSGFDSVSFMELIKTQLGDSSFIALQEYLKVLPLKTPIINDMSEEPIVNMRDAMIFSLNNLSTLLKDKKLEVELYKSMCKLEGEKNIQQMQHVDTTNIIDYLNDQCMQRTGISLTDTILNTLEKYNGKNGYNFYIAEYMTLALCGYSRDKERNWLNIMTDALHSYYAMRCDVLVTQDKGMKKKSEVEFMRFNSHTKIITIDELRPFLEEELYHEYSLDYIRNEVVPKYSVGEDRGNGNYAYKNVPSPIFGLFTNCITVPSVADVLALKVNLLPNGYVYYTELKRFFNLVMNTLSKKQKVVFQQQVIDKFLTEDNNVILTAWTFFYFEDWQIEIIADPESSVPLPMLIVRKRPRTLWGHIASKISSLYSRMHF